MEITHQNIEAWILDWMEGTLNPEQEAALHAFVAVHPVYSELLEMQDLPTLQQPASPKFDVSSLKKKVVGNGSIDESNWEHYFILYSENQLSPDEKLQVESFVAQNESLKREFGLYNKVKLEADTSITFEAKEKAKHALKGVGSINESNWEQYVIASIENQLNSVSQNDVFAFLHTNEDIQVEYDNYAKSKLKPNKKEVYPNKSELKKGFMTIVYRDYRNQVFAAAAAILALLGIFWVVATGNFTHQPQVAEVKPAATTQPKGPKKQGEYKLVPLINSSTTVKSEPKTTPKAADRILKQGNPKGDNKVEPAPTPAAVEERIIDEVAWMKAKTDVQLSEIPVITPMDEAPIAMQGRLKPAVPNNIAKPTMPAAKDYVTPLELAKNFIKKKTGIEMKKPQPEEDLLVAGTEGINKVFNTKWKLERQRDANGDVTAFSFSAGSFEISRNK